MQRKILIAAALAASLAAPAQAGPCHALDPWSGPDKTKHFAVGVAIGAAGQLVFRDPHKALLLGAGIGALKEVVDRGSLRHSCTFQDFAVTALGAAAGAYGTAWIVTPRFVGYARAF